MSNLRLFLLLGLALVGLQLWSAWQADYGPKPEPAAVAESPDAAAPAGDVPTPAAATADGEVPVAPAETAAAADTVAPVETSVADTGQRVIIANPAANLTGVFGYWRFASVVTCAGRRNVDSRRRPRADFRRAERSFEIASPRASSWRLSAS